MVSIVWHCLKPLVAVVAFREVIGAQQQIHATVVKSTGAQQFSQRYFKSFKWTMRLLN
jgi:hypothetical protein